MLVFSLYVWGLAFVSVLTINRFAISRTCGSEPVTYDRTSATIYRYLHRQGRTRGQFITPLSPYSYLYRQGWVYALLNPLKNTPKSCIRNFKCDTIFT